jgi:hypothetical protein
MENDMSDIAKELRERSLRAEQEGEPLALLDEAADEIERLRLTDEEREAIREAVGAYNDNDDDEECAKIAATLRGLLGRTK